LPSLPVFLYYREDITSFDSAIFNLTICLYFMRVSDIIFPTNVTSVEHILPFFNFKSMYTDTYVFLFLKSWIYEVFSCYSFLANSNLVTREHLTSLRQVEPLTEIPIIRCDTVRISNVCLLYLQMKETVASVQKCNLGTQK
jgi:hypothetical protein